jgi:uncharacterized membrane protein
MLWLFTAFLGGIAAAVIQPSLWPIGAALGGGFGWLLGSGVGTGRAETQRRADARLAAMERQIVELRRRVAQLESPAAGSAAPQAAPLQTAAPLPPPASAAAPIAAPPPRPPSPPPARRPQPRPPLQDWSRLWRQIAGQNALVRVGIVLLFFGVSFLLRLAYAHLHVPIEVRMLAVAAGAAALFAIGWRLRVRRRGFALSLQGGGVGILYVTIFASLRLFELIPPGLALALMAGLAVASVALAAAQESQVFAVLGVTGGFLAPILASSGGGSHVLLFEYYAVLNAYVLCMAWLRSWRPLASLGFAFTFVIGGLWGFWAYRPEQLLSTEVFLVLFFLIYAAVPILFARRPEAPGDEWVDTGLVFAAPLVGFGLQVGLMREYEYGAAWSALALAIFYAALARGLWARRGAKHRFLAESYLALGVGFATLAIPLAWDAHWTSASWAVEGAALVWAGVRTRRALARGFGFALQLGAGFAFLWGIDAPAAHLALADSLVLGSAFIALSGLFSAWRLEPPRAELEPHEGAAVALLLAWGIAWWAAAGYFEIDAHVRGALQIQAGVWYALGSCLALSELHRRVDWRLAWIPALGLLPAMLVLWVATVADGQHALQHFAWLAWLAAFASHLGLLRRHESACGGDEIWLHAAGVWLFAALASRELVWAIDQQAIPGTVWPLVGWALVPAALLCALAALARAVRWPLARHSDAYLDYAAALLALFLAGWAVAVSFGSAGDPAPLRYRPILNPLDLGQAIALSSVAYWLVRRTALALPSPRAAFEWLGGAAFVCANGALLRAVHHLAGVPFEAESLYRSDLVQTSLSIFWTLIALGAMVAATRRAQRRLWLAGSALIGVVVVKLFLVDLSNVGTLERIVSFIGVGLLLLVVGYFSPVPPREGSSATRA